MELRDINLSPNPIHEKLVQKEGKGTIALLRYLDDFRKAIQTNNENINNVSELVKTGEGSPEGAVTALPGVLYINTLGGAGTTLYVKETGIENTGWVAK